MQRKIAVILVLFFVVLSFGKLWHWTRDGFKVSRISSKFISNEEVSREFYENEAAFSQLYYYLGRGRQSYVFSSEDSRFVLKIPRLDRYEVPFWVKSIPFFEAYQRAVFIDKEKRSQQFMKSLELTNEKLKEETGTLYVHSLRTSGLNKKVKIFDRMKRSYLIDLDQTCFILQEKKPLMWPIFKKHLKTQDQQGAKKMLRAFLAFLLSCERKGIANKDPTFLKNFSYEEGRVIQFDIGSFYEMGSEKPLRQALFERLAPLRSWLQEQDAELFLWLDEEVNAMGLSKEP